MNQKVGFLYHWIKANLWASATLAILLTTALCKIFSLFDPSELLFQTEPIFNVPIWWVVLAASVVELAIGGVLLFSRREQPKTLAVLGFAIMILGYRAALYVNQTHFCPCLGNVAGWWPWLGKHEGEIMLTIAFWFLFTSVYRLLHGTRPMPAASLPRNLLLLKGFTIATATFCALLLLAAIRLPSFGNIEGAEFSKMLLLSHHLGDNNGFWTDHPWLYAHCFNLLFSVTGFQLWIPRLVSIAAVAFIFHAFNRLLAFRINWVFSLFWGFFFIFWPFAFYFLTLASPGLSAFALALGGAALIVSGNSKNNLWPILAGGCLLVFAVWLNLAAILIYPGLFILLIDAAVKTKSDGRTTARAGFCQRISFGVALVALAEALQVVAVDWYSPAFGFQEIKASFGGLEDIFGSTGTLLGALAGLWFLFADRAWGKIFFAVATVASVLILHLLCPQWRDYTVFLAFPTVSLAALGLVRLGESLVQTSDAAASPAAFAFRRQASLVMAALVISLWIGFECPNLPREISSRQWVGDQGKIIAEVIDDYNGRAKWVYSRDKNLAVNSGYFVPPELINLQDQPEAKQNNAQACLQIVKNYGCDILIFESKDLEQQDRWFGQIEKDYAHVWSDPDHTVFVAKKLNPAPLPSNEDFLVRSGL